MGTKFGQLRREWKLFKEETAVTRARDNKAAWSKKNSEKFIGGSAVGRPVCLKGVQTSVRSEDVSFVNLIKEFGFLSPELCRALSSGWTGAEEPDWPCRDPAGKRLTAEGRGGER